MFLLVQNVNKSFPKACDYFVIKRSFLKTDHKQNTLTMPLQRELITCFNKRAVVIETVIVISWAYDEMYIIQFRM